VWVWTDVGWVRRVYDGLAKKIAKSYNQKYLVEDDFKLLNDVLLVPIGPINHHKDFNIRTHIFLCIIGMLFYRYLVSSQPYNVSKYAINTLYNQTL